MAGFDGIEYDLVSEADEDYDELQRIVGVAFQPMALHLPDLPLGLLEIGTGTGKTAIEVLKISPQFFMYSVDISQERHKLARVALTEYSDRVRLITEDIFCYLEANPNLVFDGAFSCLTLHNFPPNDRRSLLKTLHRNIWGGMPLVIGDKLAFDDPEEHKRVFDLHLERFSDYFIARGREDQLELWKEHYRQDDMVKWTRGQAIRDITDAGFRDVQLYWQKEDYLGAVITARS
tara:strand:- start:4237 stop:4935 length:699 start_codon:yes stop_codon:yes gene_type:complete